MYESFVYFHININVIKVIIIANELPPVFCSLRFAWEFTPDSRCVQIPLLSSNSALSSKIWLQTHAEQKKQTGAHTFSLWRFLFYALLYFFVTEPTYFNIFFTNKKAFSVGEEKCSWDEDHRHCFSSTHIILFGSLMKYVMVQNVYRKKESWSLNLGKHVCHYPGKIWWMHMDLWNFLLLLFSPIFWMGSRLWECKW